MDMSKVGSRIKAARIRKGLTQTELSRAIELTPKYISNIECGAKNPRLETFVGIANALGTDANALLVDVLDTSGQIHCSELWDRLSALTPEKQQKILRILDLLVEEL